MFEKILDIFLKAWTWITNSQARARKRYNDLRTKAEVRRALRNEKATYSDADIVADINAKMHDKINKPKSP